jgi:malonyl-CoA O-methyltransferase
VSRAVLARFEAAAVRYDSTATVQHAVAGRLAEMARALRAPPSVSAILDAGCGTGFLSRRLREEYPQAAIRAVDGAAAMVAEARRLGGADSRTAYERADLRTYAPAERFDLILSSSALHWVQPLPAAVARLADLLKPGGLFGAAVMLDGTLGELHAVRRAVACDRVPAGTLPTLRDVLGACESAGLTPAQASEQNLRKEYPSARAFLAEIHDQGLTGGAVSAAARPLTRGQIEALCRCYEAEHSTPGGVVATYRVGYVLAGRRAA